MSMRTRDLEMIGEARAAGKTGRGKTVRIAAHLTQDEVAAAISTPAEPVTRAAIGMWERGVRRPSGGRALAYGRLLRLLEAQSVVSKARDCVPLAG